MSEASTLPVRLTTVLILEQSLNDTRVLRDLFVSLPHLRATTARDLAEAERVISTKNIDVLLIDAAIWLRRNGEAARLLRTASPDSAVVVLTDTQTVGHTSLNKGAAGFLVRGEFVAEALHHSVVAAAERSVANRRRDTRLLWQERAAKVDRLTGLNNRASFEEHLGRTCAEAGPEGSPVSLIIIGIQGAAAVSNEFGPEAGDDLIRRAALGIARSLRSDDFAGRIAGDEFGVILPGADLDVARRVARRVSQEVVRLNEGQWAHLPAVILNCDVIAGSELRPESTGGEGNLVRDRAVSPIPTRREGHDGPTVA